MCTGPVDEQCELDHTSHEFDADLGRLFLDLSFWPSDNAAVGRSERLAGNRPCASEAAKAMIRSIVVRLGRASGD
jgi:hypothetical protein